MKTFSLFLIVWAAAVVTGDNTQYADSRQTVNPVIGDISYLESFGSGPAAGTDEVLRIQTHFNYVERVLRSRDISRLTKAQQANRQKMLSLLHTYSAKGVFPKNYDHPEQRVPCFIDKDGTICAVGYLVEQTAGREAAEAINAKYQYDYVLAMNDKMIDNWIASSGLTKEECAMIQPTYGPQQAENYVKPAYGISSAAAGGINVSLNIINGVQVVKGGTRRKTVAILGLIAGAGQLALGAFNYPKEEGNSMYGRYFNNAQKDLSLLNIGLGTTTIILSTWNLLSNKKPKEKSLSWNVYGLPAPDNRLQVGVSLAKRL